MSSNFKGALFALLAYALYAAHDVVVKTLGATYSTVQIIFFSVLLSFPLVTLMQLRDESPDNLIPKHPWWTLLRTMATVITGVSVFYAFSVLKLAETYSLLFGMPLFLTVLAIPILGEKVGIHRWLAVIVGFMGVMIVLRPGISELNLGHAGALFGALCSAISMVVLRKIGNDERTIVLILYPLFANFIVMAICLPFVYLPMELGDLAAIGVMSILAFVAMMSMIRAYKLSEAAFLAPMHYSQMLWAVFYGYFFFNELPDRWTTVGGAVIIGSGLYVLYRETRKSATVSPVTGTKTRIDTGTSLRMGFNILRKRGD